MTPNYHIPICMEAMPTLVIFDLQYCFPNKHKRSSYNSENSTFLKN